MMKNLCRITLGTVLLAGTLSLNQPVLAATLSGSFDWSVETGDDQKPKTTKGRALFTVDKHKKTGHFTLLGMFGNNDKRKFNIKSPVFDEDTWKLKSFYLERVKNENNTQIGKVDFDKEIAEFTLGKNKNDTDAPSLDITLPIKNLKHNTCYCKSSNFNHSNSFLATIPTLLFSFFEQPAYAQSCTCTIPEPSPFPGTIAMLVLGSSVYGIKKFRGRQRN